MEYKKLKFSPEEGFLDSSFYEDTPENSREILQRQHNQTRDFINGIVDRLNCENEGESGLESIKSPQIEGVYGNNGYEQIKDVKRQLNNVVLNEVPDGSITDIKLAEASVTKDKIKDKEITSEKFSDTCVVPCSNDTKHINGIKASDYTPISATGSFDTFKEYVTKTDISSLFGKTHNNIRYVFYNGYMHSLNLLTKEFKRLADIQIDQSMKFFIGKDGKIYFLGFSGGSSSDSYFSIYEYNLEYSELILKNKIKITATPISITHICGVDCDEEFVYIGLMTQSSSTSKNWHFLFKIKFDELETKTEIGEIYAFQDYQSDFFFLAGDDLAWSSTSNSSRLFKNCDIEEILKLEYKVYAYDNGNLLVYNSNVFLIDKETMEPKIVRTEKSTDISWFMHNGYYYKVISGFIVKSRLI